MEWKMYKLNQNNTSKRQNSINKYEQSASEIVVFLLYWNCVTLGEGLLGNYYSFRGEFPSGRLKRSN